MTCNIQLQKTIFCTIFSTDEMLLLYANSILLHNKSICMDHSFLKSRITFGEDMLYSSSIRASNEISNFNKIVSL